MEPRPKSRLAPAMIVAGALCALPVVYAFSYLANVMPKTTATQVDFLTTYRIHAEYRVGGPIAHCLFWPALQLDRKLRPGRWAATLEYRHAPILPTLEQPDEISE